MDKDDPWSGILAATAFTECSTYRTTLQSMTVQLMFGRDMILNTLFIYYWESIRRRKQLRIDKNNQNENANQKPHKY